MAEELMDAIEDSFAYNHRKHKPVAKRKGKGEEGKINKSHDNFACLLPALLCSWSRCKNGGHVRKTCYQAKDYVKGDFEGFSYIGAGSRTYCQVPLGLDDSRPDGAASHDSS